MVYAHLHQHRLRLALLGRVSIVNDVNDEIVAIDILNLQQVLADGAIGKIEGAAPGLDRV